MGRPISHKTSLSIDLDDGERARQMYRRTVAQWAAACLRGPVRLAWQGPDPLADYRSHDWRQLYRGSILDD